MKRFVILKDNCFHLIDQVLVMLIFYFRYVCTRDSNTPHHITPQISTQHNINTTQLNSRQHNSRQNKTTHHTTSQHTTSHHITHAMPCYATLHPTHPTIPSYPIQFNALQSFSPLECQPTIHHTLSYSYLWSNDGGVNIKVTLFTKTGHS